MCPHTDKDFKDKDTDFMCPHKRDTLARW